MLTGKLGVEIDMIKRNSLEEIRNRSHSTVKHVLNSHEIRSNLCIIPKAYKNHQICKITVCGVDHLEIHTKHMFQVIHIESSILLDTGIERVSTVLHQSSVSASCQMQRPCKAAYHRVARCNGHTTSIHTTAIIAII